MDISALQDVVQHIPDIAYQFSAFAGHAIEFGQPAIRMATNVTRAFGQASSLSKAEKVYHGSKLVVLNALAAFCLATGNAEGFVGTMVGNIDEVRSLSVIGETTNDHSHRKFRF